MRIVALIIAPTIAKSQHAKIQERRDAKVISLQKMAAGSSHDNTTVPLQGTEGK